MRNELAHDHESCLVDEVHRNVIHHPGHIRAQEKGRVVAIADIENVCNLRHLQHKSSPD